MIEPKTDGGKALMLNFLPQILAIQKSEKAFPIEGPGSRFELCNKLRSKYNQLLKEVEVVSHEDIVESMRPHMIIPQTLPGKELKSNFDAQIRELEASPKPFPRSGPLSIYEQVNELRRSYNEKLSSIE